MNMVLRRYAEGRDFLLLIVTLALTVFALLLLYQAAVERFDLIIVGFASGLPVIVSWFVGNRFRKLETSDCRELVPGYQARQYYALAMVGVPLLLVPAVTIAVFAHPLLACVLVLLTCLFFAVGAFPQLASGLFLLVVLSAFEERLENLVNSSAGLSLPVQLSIASILLALASLFVWLGVWYAKRTQLGTLIQIAEAQGNVLDLQKPAMQQYHDNRLLRYLHRRAQHAMVGAGQQYLRNRCSTRNQAAMMRFFLPFGGTNFIGATTIMLVVVAVLLLMSWLSFGDFSLLRMTVLVSTIMMTTVVWGVVKAIESRWQDWLMFSNLYPQTGRHIKKPFLLMGLARLAAMYVGVSVALWVMPLFLPELTMTWVFRQMYWCFLAVMLSAASGLLILTFSCLRFLWVVLVIFMPMLAVSIGETLLSTTVKTPSTDAMPLLAAKEVQVVLASYLVVSLICFGCSLKLWLSRPLDLDRG